MASSIEYSKASVTPEQMVELRGIAELLQYDMIVSQHGSVESLQGFTPLPPDTKTIILKLSGNPTCPLSEFLQDSTYLVMRRNVSRDRQTLYFIHKVEHMAVPVFDLVTVQRGGGDL